MKLTVRYFGIASEITGKREQTMELAGGSRLSHLQDRIFSEYPRLADLKSALLFAVRSEVVDDADLADGDEIAVLPPVSGG
jgi:molybdopterin synthase catalytic subunit